MLASQTKVVDRTLQVRFESLLDEHWRIVPKVTNTYCTHPDDRLDLAQEIRYQLWRAFPKYNERRSFSTWMYRIALNVAISFVRSVSREGRSLSIEGAEVEQTPAPTPTKDSSEQVTALYEFINGLDRFDRALVLLYLEEHSYQQIAEILGISETNVATKISRLKQRIRKESEIER